MTTHYIDLPLQNISLRLNQAVPNLITLGPTVIYDFHTTPEEHLERTSLPMESLDSIFADRTS